MKTLKDRRFDSPLHLLRIANEGARWASLRKSERLFYCPDTQAITFNSQLVKWKRLDLRRCWFCWFLYHGSCTPPPNGTPGIEDWIACLAIICQPKALLVVGCRQASGCLMTDSPNYSRTIQWGNKRRRR